MPNRVLVISLLLSALAATAHAEPVPGTQLEVFAESANIGGSGRSIFLRKLPVQNAVSGEINFYDVTLRLSVDGSNNVIFEHVSQVDVSPAPISSSTFRSGRYQDSLGYEYDISGPSLTPNGFESYSLNQVNVEPDGHQISGGFSTAPMATRFSGDLRYTRFNGAYDSSEQSGESFGTFTVTGTEPERRWDTSQSEDFLSATSASPSTIRFTTWDSAQAVSTIVLTYVSPTP